ncbi:MAG: hypothetical protein IT276_14790 [Ignavibacteriaceae bacterium]|nr:hypothetical protein [Ignavibacteriaceae bacterium]
MKKTTAIKKGKLIINIIFAIVLLLYILKWYLNRETDKLNNSGFDIEKPDIYR